MAYPGWKALFVFALLLVAAGPTQAQIATYYLHRENSTVVSTNMQLKTAGPDMSALTLQTVNLKNLAAGEYVIKTFETHANVPNMAGVIPSNASFIFKLYMNKTADSGVMVPYVKVYKNSATGSPICSNTGIFTLSPIRSLHTIACSTSSATTFSATDRFFLWVGVLLSSAPTVNAKGELTIETSFDSRMSVTLPTVPPNITNLSPTTGSIG